MAMEDLDRALLELLMLDTQASPASGSETERERTSQRIAEPVPSSSAVSPSAVPLSFAQRRLWMAQQFAPDDDAYHIARVFRLSGGSPIDANAVEQAIRTVISRHDVLRTAFAMQDGEPSQTVLPEVPFAMTRLDWRHLPAADIEARVAAFVTENARKPFDPAAAPLLRVSWIDLPDRQHVLAVTMHHLISDAASNDVWAREFAQAYLAVVQGTDPMAALPSLAIQYADYAQRQHAGIVSGRWQTALDGWRKDLADEYGPLQLPAPLGREAGVRRGVLRHPLDASRHAALTAWCQQAGVTPFVALLALWQLTLRRYHGEGDFLIGVPVDGRHIPGTPDLIGCFVGTQVYRARHCPAQSLRACVEDVNRTRVAALDRLDVPFELALEAARRSGGSIFQTMFNFSQSDAAPQLRVGDVQVDVLTLANDTPQFDLTLAVDWHRLGADLDLEYDRDRVEGSLAHALLDDFGGWLDALVSAADTATGAIVLAQRAAAHLAADCLPDEVAANAHDARLDPVPVRIASRAAQDPSRLAVVCGESRLTYGELLHRADALARRLIADGAGPDACIGVALERSVDMVVAVLGVLRAGAAYVPLDPEYPVERLAYIVADSGLQRIVTCPEVAARLAFPAEIRTFGVDSTDVTTTGANIAADALNATVLPEHLAYVIYTSGSTGRPKGVMVRHAALSSFIASLGERPGLTAEDRWVAVTSLSFDIAALELYLPLVSGAQLIVADKHTTRDGVALSRLLTDSRATVLQATPATWRMLLDVEADALPAERSTHRTRQPRKALQGLKGLCGGEALPPDLAQSLLARGVALWNMYGPTETTIWSLVARVDGDKTTLGAPIRATQAWVLDASLNETPAGVPGELYLGGEGLARGYWQRASLTAERFVPHPFAADGARLYRTGDLVRRRADGDIEFIGRIDQQVKIRGFRIELGEIEAGLLTCDGVREAVVTAHAGAAGVRLIGYVTALPGAQPDEADLRRAIGRTLPDYMVPGRVMVIPAMPLTPNGKIDRRALPVPQQGDAAHEAPQGSVESRLADAWRSVLRLTDDARIGRDDNFYALGGDSILTLRGVAHAAAAGIQSTPRQWFEAATLRALAASVTHEVLQQSRPEMLVRDDGRLRVAASHAQQRQWFLWALQPDSSAYHITGAMRLKGALDANAVRQAFAGMVARHEVLRTTFSDKTVDGDDTELLQIVHADLPFEWQHVEAATQEEANRRAQTFNDTPFDLRTGPLLRVALLALPGETVSEHILLVAMHHIVADGWSIDIVLREFVAGYQAAVAGQAPSLPVLTLQYADVAAWQRGRLAAGEQQRQLDWWRAALGEGETAPVLLLPSDHPREPLAQYTEASIPFSLPPALTAGVRALAAAHRATPFMIVLAAFQLLLSRHSGLRDIRVGVPIAGRELPESAPLIGLFMNTQVLRGRLDASQTISELIDRTRTHVLDASAHQALPFEALVEALAPERSLTHTPLFQVLLNYQRDDASAVQALDGLHVERYLPRTRAAQFELTLSAHELASGGLTGSFDYARELFAPDTMARLCDQLVSLLATFVAAPDTRLGDLAILTGDAHRRLIEHGETPLASAGFLPVHRRFEAHAADDADAPALVHDGVTLSRAALDARANRLAHHLIALGVKPDTRVGVALTRSVDMIVGILAVLKAGGAYVPLDPDYPPQRLADMLADSGAAVVLGHAASAHVALPDSVVRIDVDVDVDALLNTPDTAPDVPLLPAHLAYVIYTSGSTGKPKGVAISHGALAAQARVWASLCQLSAADRVLQFSTMNFDGFVEQLFPALHVGAAVVLRGPQLWSADEFVTNVARDGVTVVDLPTAYWNVLVQALDEGFDPRSQTAPLAQVRQLHVGGEAMSAQGLRRWRDHAHLGHIRLLNTYGPTEAAVTASAWAASGEANAHSASVPIGRALQGRRLYVVTPDMTLAPQGAIGELLIGGDLLARGYLDRAAQTADRFVPDPFGAPGSRAYRTGDLVRWRADGQLDYVGRADFQVKIRGFRVELGEIEAALLAQPGVREAVVTAFDSDAGTRLAAYVTGQGGRAPDATVLRAALEAALPAPLVPSAIVPLDALPMTPGGKLDRRALPAPSFELGGYVAPAGERELALAEVWAEVLGLARVGRNDNFFTLGGDSILVLRVVARAAARGIAVSPREMFVHRSLAALAAASLAATGAVLPPVTRTRHSRSALPMSHAQRRLWFLWHLQPDSSAYHVAGGIGLRGELNEAAVRHAFKDIVAQHEVLRTTFEVPDGATEAVQVVHEAPDFAWQVFDAQSTEAPAMAQAFTDAPFDLQRGPLLRVGLMRLKGAAPDADAPDFVLLIAMHHIVADGWSVGVLLDAFVAAYTAHCRVGAETPAPARAELPVQYGDYAAWQRETFDGVERDRQLAYWRALLGDVHPVADLPHDHPRHPTGEYQAARHLFQLDTATVTSVRETARRHGVTPYVVLLSAFQALLHRWCAQNEIRVGVPVSGRDQPEVANLIGVFINTLVMRADFPAHLRAGELVSLTGERTQQALDHQTLPFDSLVDALSPTRSVSHTPLFQVMFNHQREDYRVLRELPGLTTRHFDTGGEAAQFELTLNVSEASDGAIAGSFTYARELFEASTMARLSSQYATMLSALCASDDTVIDDITLIDTEAAAQLHAWGVATDDFAADAPVHVRMSAQARRTPDAIAVHGDDASLTYAALERRSNQLAHALIAQGVGPDVPVAIALERGAGMLVALLGVLKAGGCYVPLDPGYPAERLRYMLDHSGVTRLITQSSLKATLPIPAGSACLLLDRFDGETYTGTAPDITVGPEHLAYVIYTSGSTGKPKGVMVRHGGLSNFLSSLAQRPGLTADDRWVAVTSLSFDIAALELFLPLTLGAQVIVASRETARDGFALAALLQQSGATVLQSTPATWRMLLAAGRPWPALRALCGGEALPPDLADALRARGCELWNLYGPTETTIWSMLGRVVGKPVLGQVIAGTQARVLDARLQRVPPGVAGELYLGGSGLARGYFGRADLSAERFVPDPFSPDGKRLYRTGDLARWKHDGTLEFLGRTDHQVKIRGHRIELGEIEARLAASEGVGAAVVVAHESASGTQLVGYVSPAGGVVDADAMRNALAAQLPDYMVPAVILSLPALPLTPNGKIDRKALPAPDIAPRHFSAPQTADETLLAGVWREVLGVERIGRDDNFFALGGHSLQAMQVVSLLATKHTRALALRDVFAAATLSALAECLTQASPGIDTPLTTVAPIPVRDDRQRALLTQGQARLWFLWQLDPSSAAYHMTGAFRLDGQLDTQALALAVADVVKRHDVLHSHFEAVDDTPWQVVDAPDAFGWAVEDLERSGATLSDRLQALSSRPIDLTHGPILRVTLLRLGATSHVLHFATHHIVADEWSVGVLARDFGQAYTARLTGDEPAFTPLAAQYGDFAAWHREWLDDARESAQLAYWRDRLGDEHPALELPVARKRTGLRADRGARLTAELPGDVSQRVRALARRHGTTPFTVLLSAWQLTLSRYAAQKDVRVGVPVAGRVHPATDDLVGFFVNTLVIRAELAGVQTFSDLLAQTRDRMIEAQAHQDVPFARLVDALQTQRSLSHTPLFQVMFNYGARAGKPTSLPGVQFGLLANEAATARFDLVLNVFEDDAFGLSLTYACDIFERDTVGEMLAGYRTVLDRLVRDEAMLAPPEVALGDVPLIDAPALVNAKPGRTGTDKPWRPVTQTLIETARSHAGKNAVHCEGENLTYAALDAWSARVAHRLIASGVKREERVGLCLRRSAAVVPALIGVLRAGAAFVPLDPEYPADRLAYMMEDAGVSRVLTDADTRDALAALFVQREAIDIDQLRPAQGEGEGEGEGESDALRSIDEHAALHGDQLAYVIYTSGSTGRPKGVAVSHRSLALHLNDFITTYGISVADRQLQSSTINFDVALHEMLPSLMQGGSIEMRGAKPWDLATTNRQLVAQQVTFARIPTAYWQQWLHEPPDPASLALRQITVGGEGLPGDALRQWRSGPLAHIRLDNLYGPTETTVACMYRPTQDADCAQPIVSIGGPYPSRDVYVCDDAGNALPPGALGELCIGGETLARGYLGRASLTAEKFIPDPHRNDGARQYRSGDLCRQRPDGTIDFLGRMDQQVKLRGFRIELGEVEAALRSVPGVREAAAELRGQGDDRQLVGYVTGDASLSDTDLLREALQTRLPGFMIPGAFVRLEALPLMPNGKLNRAALPEPTVRKADEAAQGPVTPTEAMLFDVWRDTLGRDGFGRHDNFFAIGGDSLAALKVATNAQRRGFGHFSLEGLFAHPTIAGLASWLDETTQGRPANIVTLNRAAATQLFAIHPGYGLVGEYRPLASALDGMAQVHGVQSPMYTDAAWAPASLDALALDYATAIRRVQPTGPYRLLGWSSGAAIARHVAGVLVAQGEVVDFLGSVDGEAPEGAESLDAPAPIVDVAKTLQIDDAEIDHLLAAMQADAGRWQGVIPEGDDGRQWLATVLRIGKHFDAVSAAAHDAAPLPVPMHLWLARRDGDTTNALDAIAATRAWRAQAGHVTVETFDTDHTGIVRHPDFIASLHRALGALHPQDTSAGNRS
ncbi:Tyrocidine synthase 3 [Pandoraea iniqua]|uniref:non-ribosomal peptide synthetase n=1 Tax=Pandoraea iniqua TaxID=2508288 RepID=UPI001242D0DE|nr:non-ribosomal peptide synthetase [Pandoraea iniqua]VVE06616.1 Tyrocidine synthase 3 [Pandoraea iniqua]